MKLISHRGNINGESKHENNPEYILDTISEFEVEIDIWYIDNKIMSGHDNPQYSISIDFLHTNNQRLWIHCKNIPALFSLKDKFNCFFHDTDEAVLTSKNFIWTYPGKHLTTGCIAVMPEGKYEPNKLNICGGICSDYIGSYI
jgi:hypothetical protein